MDKIKAFILAYREWWFFAYGTVADRQVIRKTRIAEKLSQEQRVKCKAHHAQLGRKFASPKGVLIILFIALANKYTSNK